MVPQSTRRWSGRSLLDAGGRVASALRFGRGVYVYAYAVAQLLLLAECLHGRTAGVANADALC